MIAVVGLSLAMVWTGSYRRWSGWRSCSACSNSPSCWSPWRARIRTQVMPATSVRLAPERSEIPLSGRRQPGRGDHAVDDLLPAVGGAGKAAGRRRPEVARIDTAVGAVVTQAGDGRGAGRRRRPTRPRRAAPRPRYVQQIANAITPFLGDRSAAGVRRGDDRRGAGGDHRGLPDRGLGRRRSGSASSARSNTTRARRPGSTASSAPA